MVKQLEKLNKNQLLKLFAVICLSDGFVDSREYRRMVQLETQKSSEQQHNLFSYLSSRLVNKKFCSHIRKDTIRSRVHSTRLVNTLLKLCPEYKTTPGKEAKEEYLSGPQPNLEFLFNEPKEIQMLAFRIWFDFEGCVSPRFRLAKKIDKGYIYYDVAFLSEIFLSETNPGLVNDLIKLSNNLGFKALIKKDQRKWSGIDGIWVFRKKDQIGFTKFGPVTDVKVSKKSSRLSGFTKKSLCLTTYDILHWEKTHWAFKTREEAVKLKQLLDKKLIETIKMYDWRFYKENLKKEQNNMK